MDIRKFKELIAKREKIHPEDYLTIEHCDKELIDVLCEDMPGTIKYLYSECTVEEFLWLSEFLKRPWHVFRTWAMLTACATSPKNILRRQKSTELNTF